MPSTHRSQRIRAERNREERENTLDYRWQEAHRSARMQEVFPRLVEAINSYLVFGQREALTALVKEFGATSIAMDLALLTEIRSKEKTWGYCYFWLGKHGFISE